MSVMLLIALADNPYSYYITLRWIVFILSIITIIIVFKQDLTKVLYFNIAIPFIYNPIIPIHLTRTIWTVINLITIAVLILNVIIIFKFDKGKI